MPWKSGEPGNVKEFENGPRKSGKVRKFLENIEGRGIFSGF